MKIPIRPDNDQQPEEVYTVTGTLDDHGNIVPTELPPTPKKAIQEFIERLKNWKHNELQEWLMGMARPTLRKFPKLRFETWAGKYIQGIIDLFPKHRGRPRQYENNAAKAKAFRKRKSAAKSAEQLMDEIVRAYDENKDTKGRGRLELRTGGRSVMDLQEKESDSSWVLGPHDSFSPALGGSYLQRNPDTVRDRRRNTFNPDANKKKTGYAPDPKEPNESEAKFVRRQNWSINLAPTEEEKQQIVQDCIEELADNNSFQVFWCPWPKKLDYGLIYAPDNSGELIPCEDEKFGFQVATRCSMWMPDGKQCTFCSGADHIDEERGPLLQGDEILSHIEQAHRKEWRELLKAKLPTTTVKKCTGEDHERMRQKVILDVNGDPNKGRDRVHCRCGKQVYDPARNHPDMAIRRLYEK